MGQVSRIPGERPLTGCALSVLGGGVRDRIEFGGEIG